MIAIPGMDPHRQQLAHAAIRLCRKCHNVEVPRGTTYCETCKAEKRTQWRTQIRQATECPGCRDRDKLAVDLVRIKHRLDRALRALNARDDMISRRDEKIAFWRDKAAKAEALQRKLARIAREVGT